ncbi:MAG: hypothetical protein ACK56I_22015, partial [bacterium]
DLVERAEVGEETAPRDAAIGGPVGTLGELGAQHGAEVLHHHLEGHARGLERGAGARIHDEVGGSVVEPVGERVARERKQRAQVARRADGGAHDRLAVVELGGIRCVVGADSHGAGTRQEQGDQTGPEHAGKHGAS